MTQIQVVKWRTIATIIFLVTFYLLNTSQLFGQTVFTHATNSSNIKSHMSRLDNAAVNNKSNVLIFLTQHYGKYNNHQAGVWYSNGNWWIYHEDKAAMPASTKFNVLAMKPSKRAFMHKATSANIKNNWTIINHPKCNNNPNAVLFVTQHYKGKYNPKPIGVWYTNGRWAIFNQDRSPMPQGANFNVLVQQKGLASGLSNASVSTHRATATTKQNKWGNYLSTTNASNKREVLFITQNWKSRGVYNPHIPAVWHNGSVWTIYNQNKKELKTNAMFNVLAFKSSGSTGGSTNTGSNTNNTAKPNITVPSQGQVFVNNCKKAGVSWRFEWDYIVGASEYQVYVAKDGASNPIINNQTTAGNWLPYSLRQGSYFTDANLKGWYVKVRAKVNGSWGPYSNKRYFTIKSCPKPVKPTTIKFTNKSMYLVQFELSIHHKSSNPNLLPDGENITVGIGQTKSITVPGDATVEVVGKAKKLLDWVTVFSYGKESYGAGKTWCYSIDTGLGTLGHKRKTCN